MFIKICYSLVLKDSVNFVVSLEVRLFAFAVVTFISVSKFNDITAMSGSEVGLGASTVKYHFEIKLNFDKTMQESMKGIYINLL